MEIRQRTNLARNSKQLAALQEKNGRMETRIKTTVEKKMDKQMDELLEKDEQF